MSGMWEKDKEMGRRLDSVFSIGDYLILFGVQPGGEVPTDIGMARKTILDCAPLDRPDDRGEVQTLASAIADKAELATPEDFPVVAQLLRVEGKQGRNPALVLQYVRDYDTGGNSPQTPAPAAAGSRAADDDIPF